LSHGLGIAEIARYDTFDANEDAHPRSDVTKPVEPAHKLVGLSNFEHLRTVARWLQQVNDLFVRRSAKSVNEDWPAPAFAIQASRAAGSGGWRSTRQ
jgi:hypothetical protein